MNWLSTVSGDKKATYVIKWKYLLLWWDVHLLYNINRKVEGTVIHKILPLLTVVLIIDSIREHKMDFTLRSMSNTENIHIYYTRWQPHRQIYVTKYKICSSIFKDMEKMLAQLETASLIINNSLDWHAVWLMYTHNCRPRNTQVQNISFSLITYNSSHLLKFIRMGSLEHFLVKYQLPSEVWMDGWSECCLTTHRHNLGHSLS